MKTVEQLKSERDYIAVVAHKTANGIAIAWSHASNDLIARDVMQSNVIDSPHKALVLFTKSLLSENIARCVVTDVDSFVLAVNGQNKTTVLANEIMVLRYAIKTGKLVVRRPQEKGAGFFARLHAECRRDS